MTIINATTQGKAAYIITDTAYCNPDGTVAALASKFIVGRAFPFLMAPTGNPNLFRLGELIENARPRSGTDLIAKMPDILRSLEAGGGEFDLDAGFVIATWNKRHGRPMLHLIANTDNHWPGLLTPFEPYFIEHVIGGQITVDDALGRRVDVSDPRSFDPCRDGKMLVDVQRRSHRFEHMVTPAFRIGGAVEVGTLTRHRADIKQVHEWSEDRIGELIVPTMEAA